MFYVGQQFALRDSNARYTITNVSASMLYFRCQPAPGSYSFDTSFTRPQWQGYIRTGEVIPVVPIEPPTVAEYLANLTMDDVFERELGRAIYQTMERWYNRGDYRDEFSQLCSAPNTPFDGKYLSAMACDKSKDGYVNVLLTRSLKDADVTGIPVPESRYTMVKLGKVLKATYPNWSDHLIAAIVDAFKGQYATDFEYALVSGEDIADWYDEDTYHPGRSNYSLDLSCMRYSYCRDYFGIYTENPDKCRLFIVTLGGMLIGRALVWKCDDGSTYVDRFYGQSETWESAREWLTENIGTYRAHSDSERPTDGVTLKHYEFDEYPYMDTFCYLSMETGTLSRRDNSGWGYYLCSTQGGYDEYGQPVHCDRCGERTDADDLVYLSGEGDICPSCYAEFTFCDQCGDVVEDGDESERCLYCRQLVKCPECGSEYYGPDYILHVTNHPLNGPFFPVYGPFDGFVSRDNLCSAGLPLMQYYAECDAMEFAFDRSRRLAASQWGARAYA